jgi:hypothetical protein
MVQSFMKNRQYYLSCLINQYMINQRERGEEEQQPAAGESSGDVCPTFKNHHSHETFRNIFEKNAL